MKTFKEVLVNENFYSGDGFVFQKINNDQSGNAVELDPNVSQEEQDEQWAVTFAENTEVEID
jgi:hypothetical protein